MLRALLVCTLAAAFTVVGQQARKVDDTALKDVAKTGDEWLTYNLGWFE
ncbi:MAG TPA: hypothetical protein VIY49_39535 [Bryobacteraceae bacterium]